MRRCANYCAEFMFSDRCVVPGDDANPNHVRTLHPNIELSS